MKTITAVFFFLSTGFLFPLELSNKFILFRLNETDCSFQMYTTGGDPVIPEDDNIMMLYDGEVPTSFALIRINERTFRYGSSDGVFIQRPHITNAKIFSVWVIEKTVVTQTIEIINGITTGSPDTIFISYTAASGEPYTPDEKKISIMIMFDTMLGGNDGAPFNIPDFGPLTNERHFSGNAVPPFWYAYDNVSKPRITAIGSLFQNIKNKPDRVIFANLKRLLENSWSYEPPEVKKNSFASLGRADTAVGIIWENRSITAETNEFVTKYGMYGMHAHRGNTFSIAVGVPKYAQGDPFIVTADIVHERRGLIIQNAICSVAFDYEATHVLDIGRVYTKPKKISTNFGKMYVGQTKQVSWEIHPPEVTRFTAMPIVFTVDGTPEPGSSAVIPPAIIKKTVILRPRQEHEQNKEQSRADFHDMRFDALRIHLSGQEEVFSNEFQFIASIVHSLEGVVVYDAVINIQVPPVLHMQSFVTNFCLQPEGVYSAQAGTITHGSTNVFPMIFSVQPLSDRTPCIIRCSVSGRIELLEDSINEITASEYTVYINPPPVMHTNIPENMPENPAMPVIFFEKNSTVIAPEFYAELDKVIEYLLELQKSALSNITVRIEGHTDSSGETAHNMRLSEARANAVLQYLTGKGRLDKELFIVQGLGNTAAATAENTEEDRQKNRRVEIRIKPVVK